MLCLLRLHRWGDWYDILLVDRPSGRVVVQESVCRRCPKGRHRKLRVA